MSRYIDHPEVIGAVIAALEGRRITGSDATLKLTQIFQTQRLRFEHEKGILNRQ